MPATSVATSPIPPSMAPAMLPFTYATVDDVRAKNVGRPIGTSTEPNEDQVIEYLGDTAGILDGLLRQQGYQTPIGTTAATSAQRTMQNFNAIGAWYYVESSAKVANRLTEAKDMWEWAQRMLGEGMIELDAPIDAAQALPRGGFSSASPAFFARDMEL